jgi:glycolate oxidase FAD binding subunit
MAKQRQHRGGEPGPTDRLEARLTAALGGASVSRAADGAVHVTPLGREPARLTARLLAEERQPWRPVGSARRPGGGVDVRIHTTELRGVLDFWPADLVARVGAGTTLTQLNTELDPLGLRLAASAPLPDQATLGGVLAAGDRGLRGATGDGLREQVLGLAAVTGAGHVHTAGARVVKNVAGYDLARLHAGAAGAFGLVLDVVVRLEARPEAARGVFLPSSVATLAPDLARLRRPQTATDPVALVFVDACAAAELDLGDRAGLLALAEGWQESVEAWVRELPDAIVPAAFEPVADVGWTDPDRWLLRWLVTPTRLIVAWPRLRQELEGAGLRYALAADCLGGQATLAVAAAGPTHEAVARLDAVLEAAAPPGRMFLDRRPTALAAGAPGRVWPHASRSGAEDILQRLKRAFDPHGLLPPFPRGWSVEND